MLFHHSYNIMKTIIFDLDGTLVRLQPAIISIADIETLKILSQKYNLALVSGSPNEEIKTALTQTGLSAFLESDYIVGKEDSTGDKASGIPFENMKSRLTGTYVMIGDSPSDEEGCRVARIPFVKVNTCSTIQEQKEELARAITEAVRLLAI
jgi:phosphoglycolate phosphatase-like HAD superfamily hydrolase